MIYIVINRQAVCEICRGDWIITDPIQQPETCLHCGSKDWRYGVTPGDSALVRKAISRARRKLNPGATSRKRQEHGRKQWRQFKPKEDKE